MFWREFPFLVLHIGADGEHVNDMSLVFLVKYLVKTFTIFFFIYVIFNFIFFIFDYKDIFILFYTLTEIFLNDVESII